MRMGIRRGGHDHRPLCLLGNALQICCDIVVRLVSDLAREGFNKVFVGVLFVVME